MHPIFPRKGSTDAGGYNSSSEWATATSTDTSSSAARSNFRSVRQPRTYVTKTVEKTKQSYRLVRTEIFQERRTEFSTELAKPNEQLVSMRRRVHQEILPQLPDGSGSSFHFGHRVAKTFRIAHWHKKTLSSLLMNARENNTPISQRDLADILRLYKNKKFGNDVKIFCFRILHYLAEHRWKLNKKAINTIIKASREASKQKTFELIFSYIGYALGYTILHHHEFTWPKDIETILNQLIKLICDKDEKKYLEVILVLIAAKAKLNKNITTDDLNKIKFAISDERDPSTSVQYHPSTHLHPIQDLKKRFKNLNGIENHVIKGGGLSCQEFRYIFGQCSSKEENISFQAMRILRQAIQNDQREFSPQLRPGLDGVLVNHLSTFECELRTDALVIAKVLLINGKLSESRLQTNFYTGRRREQFLALSALRKYIQNSGKEGLQDSIWSRLIDLIRQNDLNNSEIKRLASFIYFLLHSEPKHLKSLILDAEYSIHATEAYLNAVKQGTNIDPDVQESLNKLIIEHKDYDPGTRLNAMAIFRYIAEKPQQIYERVICDAINVLMDPNSDGDFINSALLLLGRSATLQLSVIVLPERNPSGLLHRLLTFMNEKETVHATIFFLCQWIDALTTPYHHQEEFNRIFERIIEKLIPSEQVLTTEDKKSLTRVLGKAAEKNFPLNPVLIENLIGIALATNDELMKHRCIDVLLAYYRSCSELYWSEPLFSLLYDLSLSDHVTHFSIAANFLIYYFKHLVESPHPDKIDLLATYFHPRRDLSHQLDLGFELYQIIVDKKWLLSPLSLNVLASSMLNENIEFHTDIAIFLALVSERQKGFERSVIKKVIKGASSTDEVIVESSILILERNIDVMMEKKGNLVEQVIPSLLNIVLTTHYDAKLRLKAISLIKSLSTQNQAYRFSLNQIDQLIRLLTDHNDPICNTALQLIAQQVVHLCHFIDTQTAFIKEIEMAVIPFLNEGNSEKDVIIILTELTKFGYRLSKHSFGKITHALFQQYDVVVAKQIFFLIEKYKDLLEKKKEKIPNEISNILEVQEICKQLEHRTPLIQTTLEPMSRLIHKVEKQERMVACVFDIIAKLIEDYANVYVDDNHSFHKLFEKILIFCQKILERDKLPFPKLLQSICRLEENQRLSENPQISQNNLYRQMLVATYLNANYSIDPAAYMILEKGFLADNSSENNLIYLEALNTVIKRGHVIRSETVEKLWNILFQSNDKQTSWVSLEILIDLTDQKDPQFVRIASHYVQELLGLIIVPMSKKKRIKVNILIEQIKDAITLQEDQAKQVFQKILSVSDFSRQYQLCCLLSSQNQAMIHPECFALIKYKEAEYRVLDKTKLPLCNFSSDQIENELKILSESDFSPSSDFFIRVETLIIHLDDTCCKLLLEHVGQIAQKKEIPDALLHALLRLKEDHLSLALKVFDTTADKHRQISEDVISMLQTLLLYSPNDPLRDIVYELFQKITEYQSLPKEVGNLIAIESRELNEEVIQNIHAYAANGGKLSTGNTRLLITNMDKAEFITTITMIFDTVEEEFPQPSIKIIVSKYQELFSHFVKEQHYFIKFFAFALRKKTVDSASGIALYQIIFSKMKDKTVFTKNEVNLLRDLTSSFDIEIEDFFFINFIRSYIEENDDQVRLSILFLLFEQLLKKKVWSKPLFSNLTELANLFRSQVPENFALSLNSFLFLESIALTTGEERRLTLFRNSDFSTSESLLEEVILLFHLLCFVLEHSNADLYFRELAVERSKNLFPNQQLLTAIEKKISTSPREDRDQFRLLLADSECSLRSDIYRQLLTQFLFRAYEEKLLLTEVNEILEMYSQLSTPSFDLFHQNFNTIQKRFLHELFDRLNSFQAASQDIQHTIFSAYQKVKWPPKWAKQIFGCLTSNTTVEQLLDLLSFLSEFPINPEFVGELLQQNCQASDLKNQIMANLLIDQLAPLFYGSSYEFMDSAHRKIHSTWLASSTRSALTLCQQGWSIKRLIDWLHQLNIDLQNQPQLAFDIKDMANLLGMILCYRIQIDEELFYSLSKKHHEQGKVVKSENLHAFIVSHHLSQKAKEKKVSVLLNELASSEKNQADDLLMKQVNEGQIITSLQRMEDLYIASYSNPAFAQMSPSSKAIKDWSKAEIQAWAREIRDCASQESGIEEKIFPHCLAVLRRASILLYGFEPRVVQFIVLLVISQRSNPGILAQISTGEGKSLIIAMLAIIKGLQGKNVDVITSSSILASRDAKSYQPFYDYFSLKAVSNEDHQYKDGLKGCYEKGIDIVYGDPSHFQFDYLRHNYSELGTRGERNYSVAIMDEVDNVLVEGIDSLAMLASPIPCMQELNPLLAFIWFKLVKIHDMRRTAEETQTLTEDEKSEPEIDADNLFFEVNLEDKYEVRLITEEALLRYIEEHTNLYQPLDPLSKEENDKFVIPEHLKSFVKAHMKDWVRNACLAFYDYELQHHYEIQKNPQGMPCIAPIDFANTGMIQLGTSWGDGLHQFLQMKHALPIEPLNLVTNFLSIYSYVKLYSEAIGITGTLGSPRLQQLILKMYNYSCVEIPTFLPRKEIKLVPELLPTKKDWVQTVGLGAIREAKLGRVVLIISETIAYARQFKEFIQSVCLQNRSGMNVGTRVELYIDDKDESIHFLEKELEGNTIIVATNLAGRGTDFRLSSSVIKKGGLHVCVTFLPGNSRVGLQAFGRSSRRGEPGTVQLVLNCKHFLGKLSQVTHQDLDLLKTNPFHIEKMRDTEESKQLEAIENDQLPDIIRQSTLFTGYLTLLKKIKKHDDGTEKKSIVDNVKKKISAKSIYREELIKVKRSALEERWGRWLRMKQNNENTSTLSEDFTSFCDEMFIVYCGDTIIDNPIYYILLGNQLLAKANAFYLRLSRDKLINYAIKAYGAAVEIDPIFSYNAYYHQAYALMKLGEKGYKKRAKELLEKMKSNLLAGPIKQHYGMNLWLGELQNDPSNDLTSHLVTELDRERQIYHLILDSANETIEEIETSQKLIRLRFGLDCYSNTTTHKYTTSGARTCLSKYAGSNQQVDLTFYHLKTHSDLTEHSQLRETLTNIAADVKAELTFYSDKLYSKPDALLRSLLPIHRKNKKNLVEHEAKMAQQDRVKPNEKESKPATFNAGSTTPLTFGPTAVKDYVQMGFNKGFQIITTASQKLHHVNETVRKKMTTPIEAIKEWRNKYGETEAFLVTLKIKKLSGEEILLALKSLPVGSSQSFGIGPIKINRPLLEHLRKVYIDLKVVLWIPSQEESLGASVELVSISDSQLELPKTEISILECSKDFLNDVLPLIGNQKEHTLQLVLRQLEQKNADAWMKKVNYPTELSFICLTKEQICKIIDITSEEHNQATLTFRQISTDSAKTIINNASRKKEKICVNPRDIKAEFSKISPLPSFIHHHRLNGYCYLFQAKEKIPLPWKSLTMLSALSLTQIAGGLGLTLFTGGIGGSIGPGLIIEGIAEVMRGFSVTSTREFDLSSYLLQKSWSFTMILGSAGLSNFAAARAAAKARSGGNLALQQGNDVTRAAMERLITSSRQFVMNAAETGAKETVTRGIQAAKGGIMQKIGPDLKKEMKAEIDRIFNKDHWKKMLNKLFAIDAFLGSAIEEKGIFVEVKRIFSTSQFTGDPTFVLNKEGIALFEKHFPIYLDKRIESLSNFQEMFQKKLTESGVIKSKKGGLESTELSKTIVLLTKKRMIDAFGEVNFEELRRYAKAFNEVEKYNIAIYDLSKLAWSDREGKQHIILEAFLSYTKLLHVDYFVQRQKLIDTIFTHFYGEFSSSLNTFVNLVENAITEIAHVGVARLSNKYRKQQDRRQREERTGPRRRESNQRVAETIHSGGGGEHPTSRSSPPREGILVSGSQINPIDQIGDRRPIPVFLSSEAPRYGSTPQLLPAHVPVGDRSQFRRGYGSFPPSSEDRVPLQRVPVGSRRTEGPISRSMGTQPKSNRRIRLAQRPSSLVTSNRNSETSNFCLKSISTTAEISMKNLHILCLIEYNRIYTFVYKEKQALLAQQTFEHAKESEETFRLLIGEQINIIKCLIGLILIESELHGSPSKLLDSEARESLDLNIDTIFREGRRSLGSGRTPSTVAAEFKRSLKGTYSPTQSYFNDLQNAWDKYCQLEKRKKGVFSSVEQILNMREEIGTLVKQHDYTNLGKFLQKRSLSTAAFTQGMIIQELGNIAKGLIEANSNATLAHLRFQSMTLAFVQNALSNHAYIHETTLDISQKQNLIVKKVVKHRTAIAKMISDEYTEVLNALKSRFNEKPDRNECFLSINEMLNNFTRRQNNINSMVELQKETVKEYSIDSSVISLCMKDASESVKNLIDCALDTVKKDRNELNLIVRELCSQVQIDPTHKGAGLVNNGNDCFFNAMIQLIMNSDLRNVFSDRNNLTYGAHQRSDEEEKQNCDETFEFFIKLVESYKNAAAFGGVAEYSHRELRKMLKLDEHFHAITQWDCVEAFNRFCDYYHLGSIVSEFQLKRNIDLSNKIKIESISKLDERGLNNYSEVDDQGVVLGTKPVKCIVQMINLEPNVSMQRIVNKIFETQEVRGEYKFLITSETNNQEWDLYSTQTICEQLNVNEAGLKDHLMLHVQRFIGMGANFQKDEMDLPKDLFEINVGGCRYELIGFVVHSGQERHGGHYFAFVKMRGGWMKWDDRTGTPYPNIEPPPVSSSASASSSTPTQATTREHQVDLHPEVMTGALQAYLLHYLRLPN